MNSARSDAMNSLFPLPEPDTLHAALLRRDPAYEGRAWVGVTTTGIFCRLTCPARKPLAENCRWFDSPAAALSAGFRPCRRCHPLGPEAAGALGALVMLLPIPLAARVGAVWEMRRERQASSLL